MGGYIHAATTVSASQRLNGAGGSWGGWLAGCTGRKHKTRCVVFKVYKTDLEKDIISDTSGDFRKLMVALAKVGFRFLSLSLFPPKASHIPHFIPGSELSQSSVPASEMPASFLTLGLHCHCRDVIFV